MAERCRKRVNLKLFCDGKECICVKSRAVGSPGEPWSYIIYLITSSFFSFQSVGNWWLMVAMETKYHARNPPPPLYIIVSHSQPRFLQRKSLVERNRTSCSGSPRSTAQNNCTTCSQLRVQNEALLPLLK